MFINLEYQLISKACFLFSNSTVKVHDSQAYRNMEMNRECINFTFDPRNRCYLLSFFMRDYVACAILEKTSGLKPSCKKTAVWYLKRVTLPSFCSFTLISLWVSLALSFVAWASSSSSSSARASTPSANRRLVITAIYVSFFILFQESVEEGG